MFGRKQKRIDQLERELLQARQALLNQKAAANDHITTLARELRQMDDAVFAMHNQMSWEGMRPHFQRMSEQTMARKLIESKRINDLLIPELEATYGQPKKALPAR